MAALTLPLFLALLATLWRRGSDPRPAALLGVSLLALGASEPDLDEDRHTVGASATAGDYQLTCGGQRRFAGAGVHYSYLDEVVDDQLAIGASVDASAVPSTDANDRVLVSTVVAPRFLLEHRWVGLGLGANVGLMEMNGNYDPAFGVDQGFGLTPGARLRIGPRDIVYFEGAFFDHRPSAFPNPRLELSVGVAVSSIANDFELSRMRLGITTSGFMLAPTFALPMGWMVDSMVAVGDRNTWQLSLGVRRHLARKGH